MALVSSPFPTYEQLFPCLAYSSTLKMEAAPRLCLPNTECHIANDVNLITYLLTSWSRVLLEKLTDYRLVKKFPAFYGTRRFIIIFTSACHLSLSWARPIQ